MSVKETLQKTGPKKLLALDGGGIRGMISIEVLAQIEKLLQEKLGRDDSFVLSDYFDYIAGTSTGGIIAAGLSLGMRVSKLRDFYLDNGKEMFDPSSILRSFHYKYAADKLTTKLQEVFGVDTTLGSDKLRTLLMLVMRNATTDSPWPVSNNPQAKYNDRARPDCNLQLPLWQLVRASTAAPTFFPPELVTIGSREFLFVDGGVTPYNNPAFLLFLTSTLEPYRIMWPSGEQQLLLVSVGTGTTPDVRVDLKPQSMHLLYNARSVPSALIYSSLNEQDMLCRSFGRCRVGGLLDQEIGTLQGEFKGPVAQRLFTYLRYNTELTHEGMTALGLPEINPEHLQQLDSIEYMSELQAVGKAVAKTVRLEHFESFLPALP
ncbi:patatin [Corallococcus exercitus]|uniref:Patatin n=1 Tax=Corallococcus exercitus TaxID=2316736 RepID=A0A7Y4NTR1_9BACT|nr:patatin-like phospholipase family protein [Corallococcus exercitus]NOK36051.1 patatin [Corallococcus exercitus]